MVGRQSWAQSPPRPPSWVPLALAHLSQVSQPRLCLVPWPGQAEAARGREARTLVPAWTAEPLPRPAPSARPPHQMTSRPHRPQHLPRHTGLLRKDGEGSPSQTAVKASDAARGALRRTEWEGGEAAPERKQQRWSERHCAAGQERLRLHKLAGGCSAGMATASNRLALRAEPSFFGNATSNTGGRGPGRRRPTPGH